MDEQRIAAFGGTFDPIHNGHLEVVRSIVQNFVLDQLLIVPSNRPPHKNPRSIAAAYHRFAMAILASLEEPRVKVSTIELEEPEHPYTFETIERLRNTLGESTRLFFVIGADSFEEISTWREPARLLSSTNVIVVTRPGYSVKSSHLEPGSRSMVVDLRQRHEPFEIEEALNQYHIYVTGYVDNAISSTEIRRRVRDGESIEGMVPPGVADYITKYELYKAVN